MFEDDLVLDVNANDLKKKKKKNNNKANFVLGEIDPKTENQEKIFDTFEDENKECIVIHGYPGTGKTFVSLYLALSEIDLYPELYDRILILRSAVATRNIGFLPGNSKEKMQEFESPYADIVNQLYNRGDAWTVLKNKNQIDFASTSFLRGKTFDRTIVILDEFQNLSFHELHTVITRIGENTKLVLIGDTGQDDLTSERFHETSGGKKMMEVLSRMKEVEVIEMDENDIVRSGFVKSYIKKLYNIY